MNYSVPSRTSIIKRIEAFSLLLLLLFSTGCGQQQADAGASVNNVMGSYVEQAIAIDGLGSYTSQIYPLFNGEFALYDYDNALLYHSTEKGQKWNTIDAPCLDTMENDSVYINRIAIGPGGEVLAESLERNPANADSQNNHPVLRFADASGQVQEATFGRDQVMAGKLAIDSTGTPYLCEDADSTVYRLNFSTNQMETVLVAKERILAFDICGDKVIVITKLGSQIFDLTTNTMLEDPTTLNEFLESGGFFKSEANLFVETIFFAADSAQNAIYFLCGSGIYRYIIGGSCVEQLTGDEIRGLNSPNNSIRGLALMESGNLLMAGSETGLLEVSFDANQTEVVTTELKVYSLYSNVTLRQVIAQFQIDHPEVEVTYEVGILDLSAITYEDALKNLNTEVLAGTGPDIILMDRLDIATYVENGLLLDLSTDTSWRPEEPLLENVVTGLQSDNGLYTVPAKFTIPVLIGPSGITNVTNLSDLTMLVETLHTENPDKDIFQCYQPETLLNALFYLDPKSLGNAEELTRDELMAFLENAKRIYDVQTACMPSYVVPMTDEELQCLTRAATTFAEDEALSSIAHASSVALDVSALGSCSIGGILYDYHILPSAVLQNDSITFTYGLSGTENYYKPGCELSICTTSEHQDIAMQFLKTAFSTPVQSAELGDGLPVNMDAFASMCVEGNTVNENYGFYTPLGASSPLSLCYCTQDDYASLEQAMNDLSTPIMIPEIVTASILEIAPDYFLGASTLEETTDAIMSKIELRMAE